MLNRNRALPLTIAIAVASFAVTFSGCNRNAEPNASENPQGPGTVWHTQPPVNERLRGDGAMVAAPFGETMDFMLYHAPLVVLVTIETYEDATNSSDFAENYVKPPVENEVQRQAADSSAQVDPDYIPRIALFSATLDRTIAGSASTLDGTSTLLLMQSGGYAHGNAYEGELDPLLEVGKRYLLFLGESGTTAPGAPALYSPSPMGKFEVRADSTLAKVWPMDFGPAIPLLLHGKSVDGAVAIIEEGVRNYTPLERD